MRAMPTIILEYGKRPPNRWRRLARWTIVAVLLVTLAFAGLFALRNLSIWLARREGFRAVAAWHQQASAAVVPAGTLLYSERPEDLTSMHSTRWSAAVGSYRSETFELTFPSLRQVVYDAQGVPKLSEGGRILYAHEHDYWDVPSGKRPSLLCLRYQGPDDRGRPQFYAFAYRLVGPGGKPMIPTMASSTYADVPPTRSLANLRIFAGAPHPTDRTRFSLPFDCDGGRGRFEFQTDADVTDGGRVAPSVRIEWDDAATQPGAATRPAGAD